MAGADLLARGANRMALRFGISPLAIGLTVVAYGTSTQELAVSVQAGQADIAVGNIVGSNLYNILAIAALVTPDGLVVAPSLIHFDLPVMIARWEGALFLAYYAAYVSHLILASTAHDALPAFSGVMLGFVLPLTLVTLLVLWVRWWSKGLAR